MKRAIRILIFVGLAVFATGLEFPRDSSLHLALVGDAHAIIGAPLTPVSYAGVARRTTRRAVVVTSSAAASNASASESAEAAAKSAEAAQTATVSSAAAQPHGGVPIGTVVFALPKDCTSVTVNGRSFSDCGGSFYQAALQGNNLVYVVVQSPLQ